MNANETAAVVAATFHIHAENLPTFEARMTKLARRAARIGCAMPTYTIGECKVSRASNIPGHPDYERMYRTYAVTVTGEAPRIAGWTFVAALSRTEAGTIVRNISGADLPERYRNATQDCDHCRAARRRNDVYVVRSDAGEYKQIGSTCLRDFMGHTDPESIAMAGEILADAFDAGEEGSDGAGCADRRAYALDVFVAWCAAACREFGWVSRKASRESFEATMATADRAYGAMTAASRKEKTPEWKPTEADTKLAADAIAWAETLAGGSEYEHNLSVIARSEFLPERGSGIAASMVSAYQRHLGQEAERRAAAAVSRHVGAVGERLVLTVTIVSRRSLESNYGASELYVFAADDGARLKTFSTSREELGAIGETVTIKGTVKRHEEYKGVQMTLLTRCATYVAPAPKVRKPRAKKADASEAA